MQYTLPATVVMKIHNVSRNELYRWIKTGKLSAQKRGKPLQWHFIPDEVESLRKQRLELFEIQIAQISESVDDYLIRKH